MDALMNDRSTTKYESLAQLRFDVRSKVDLVTRHVEFHLEHEAGR